MKKIITVFAVFCLMALPGVASAETIYKAEFEPINLDNLKQKPAGYAHLRINEETDQLLITLEANGLSAGPHLMHLHGFKEGTAEANCASPQADTNNDGYLDLMETHAASGETLVPFHDYPASLEIMTETYPEAGTRGMLVYKKAVDLDALGEAMQEKHRIDDLSLENRVIYIHGLPEGSTLPDTIQSLEGVPAAMTLPIACANIQKME